MIELSKLEEDLQDPGKAQGPVEAQLFGAEAGEAASPSASSPTVSCSTLAEALPQEALNEMVANLMKFFLHKYLAKQLTSQAEMLKVLRDNQEHFSVVFTQASQCLQVVIGMEMKDLNPREHIYIMVPTLGLTCDEMLSSGQSLPKVGFLVLVLSLIMQNEDLAPEEAVLGALSRMGREHCVFGEPRELLTQGYLEYQQVPDSHPAYVETSKWQVMVFVLRVKQRALRAFPLLSAEAAREEE
uniref:MAGE domain-containing protein n=1 Tax=Capra hircus TaxID=9925 RepID=A0A452E4L2_CAPHI